MFQFCICRTDKPPTATEAGSPPEFLGNVSYLRAHIHPKHRDMWVFGRPEISTESSSHNDNRNRSRNTDKEDSSNGASLSDLQHTSNVVFVKVSQSLLI
jgi:hypothetical protein